MAKSKKIENQVKAAASTPDVTGTRTDAIRALCCVTGCGLMAAEARLDALPSETAQTIADHEANGRRDQVAQLLNQQDELPNEAAQSDPNLHSASESTDGGTGPAA